MSIRIEDGNGKGYLAGVTSANKIRTYSTVEFEAAYESEENGNCYSWSASYSYGAGDTVLLLKNDDVSKNLLIDRIVLAGSASTQVVIHSPSVTTPTGTAVTGVNVNRGSGKLSATTAIQDETTNTQANVLMRAFIGASASSLVLTPYGSIVVPYNGCIAIDYMTSGICYATIIGYYRKSEF